ncbi:MAG: exodeoxyribonuclease VII large subunit [Anaerolineaceae bacterium]|nr:exodeoxyribonuclease VII large subunit [Anaerolineaceae bacterium]
MFQGNLFQSFEVPVLTVTQLNHYLRQLLESDELLQKIWIKGEVSNVSRPHSGHIYFTLKDKKAAINCVIWRSSAERMAELPANGSAVEARGYISVYEQGGRVQLYVDQIRVSGEGLLYQQFIELKAQLEAEGLFDEELKRPVPAFPKTIGIVTSATGAAVQDMINTIQQRFPLAEIIIAPAAVQGDAAPMEIVRGILSLNRFIHPDIILVGRGGGSLEDLWSFNDERVVRAIAASEAPIISGVGHETDFTLSDFAADVRAPTPTGAAVLATPDIHEIEDVLNTQNFRLNNLMAGNIELLKTRFKTLETRLRLVSPEFDIQSEIQHLDDLNHHLSRNSSSIINAEIVRINALSRRLAILNPINVLERGYAIIELADGSILKSVSQSTIGDIIQIKVTDGSMKANIEEIIKGTGASF